MSEELHCLDDRQDGSCEGTIELRMPLSSTGKPFPRCDHHWDLRLKENERIERLYAPNSDVPPPGFDPTYAGERWEED